MSIKSVGALFDPLMKDALRLLKLPTNGPLVLADAGRYTPWTWKMGNVKLQLQILEEKASQEGVPLPECQLFLCDLPDHDFNSLSLLIEELKLPCFIATSPGTHFRRLFPLRSIHFFSSLNWLLFLDRLPDAFYDKSSPAYNKGHVGIRHSSPAVQAAFKEQSLKELTAFFEARAEELVPGGVLYLLFGTDSPGQWINIFVETTELAFDELVEEGVLTNETQDRVNFPLALRNEEDIQQALDNVASLYHVYHSARTVPHENLGELLGVTDDAAVIGVYTAAVRTNNFGRYLEKELGTEDCEKFFDRWRKILANLPLEIGKMPLGYAFSCILIRK